MAMEKEQPKLRVVMFPWLAHGHITPFLELSKKLSATNLFTIHFISTSVNLNSIKQHMMMSDHDHDDDPSLNLVELQIPSNPNLPPHLHTTKNLPSHLLPTLLQAFQESSSSFSHICDSVNPNLVIYDVFQPWAPKIASSKGIPSVLFSTVGAASFSFFHNVYTQGSSSTFPFPAIHLPQHEMDRIRNRIGPNIKHDGNDSSSSGMIHESTEIVLVKSSKHVEEKYLNYLSASCMKEIVCTGPLISEAHKQDDDDEGFMIMKWLREKSHFSTIYISFGSECFPSKDQIAEIAKGLLLCDANFIWVIRSLDTDTMIENQLPEGFLERVKERGLVIPWAPQTKILSHPSIGGFVTHCGWSSIMESVYYGVPVIAMPMKSEQPLNAQLVAEAGAGVVVERGGECDGMYVGEEVARAINKVMVEKAVGEGLRNAAWRLREKMREREDEEVAEVAEKLLRICMKNKKQE